MKSFFISVRKKVMILIFPMIAGLILVSCLKDNDLNDDNPVAGLMAFNLAPDAPFVGFTVSGGNLTASPLAYNSYTGVYRAVYPGAATVEAYNFNSGVSLAASGYTFEDSSYNSVFLVGTSGAYQNVVVKDELTQLTSSDQAYIRYINAIPDSSNPSVTVSVNGSVVINENAAFKNVSSFTAIDPGEVRIAVSNGSTIDTERIVTLEEKKVYTILLIGKPGDTGETAVQIKYILNGTTDESVNRSNSSSGRPVN